METIFITGAGPRGVTGRLIREYFNGKYELLTPSSQDLDLTNSDDVIEYFNTHKIDYVIHCATFRPASIHHGHFVDEELESNLRMYYNLASLSHRYKKMIYFGSGAEYDKTKSIININEESFSRSIPKNKYGLGKFIMNTHARNSANIYNFRLFGTINKYERPDKNVVSNLCVKAINGIPFTLLRDCKFSFVDISDVLQIIDYSLKNDLRYHDYNLTTGQTILLSEVADIVAGIAGIETQVSFEYDGYSNEYTGDNSRILKEISFKFTPIKNSIEKVYNYYKSMGASIDLADIDKRWK